LLGHALKDLGALDKAMAVLREAHRYHPDDFWLNDALGYFSKDFCRPPRYDDALRYYSMTVALRPKTWQTHFAVGRLLEQKGATDEAIAEYSRVIELDPGNARAWRERAGAYDGVRQYENAIGDYSRVIELDAKNAAAWGLRGHAYKNLLQYDMAIADYTKAIELDPENAWHFNRGIVYTDLHEYDKAIADYTKFIELHPKFAWAWHIRGKSYNNLHQYNKALADYSKATELDPKYSNSWDQLAWLFATCPDPRFRDSGTALRFAQKAVELAPTVGNHWNTLGAAHYRAGEWKAAVEALSKSDELLKGQKLGFRAFFLAMAHWQLGEKDKARQWYEKAVQWMEKNLPKNEELRRFRAEAAELLGIEAHPAEQEKKKPPAEGPSP
jgi:tetratricopeptide (TPR) repeat protein